MDSIGIKLADGSFYPILESGKAAKRQLSLTTVKDNQTTVHVDVYRSHTGSMEDAEYVDTLEIENLNPHGNGEPDLNLDIELDEENKLSAQIHDPETGKKVSLISRTAAERSTPANFSISPDQPSDPDKNPFDDIFAEPEEAAQPEETPQPSFEDIVNSISAGTAPEPYTITDDEVKKLDEDASTQTEDNSVIGPSPNSEDFIFDGEPERNLSDELEDIAPPDEIPEPQEEKKTDDDFVLPDFDALESSEAAPDGGNAAEAAPKTIPAEGSFELEDYIDAPAEESTGSDIVTADNFELPDFDEAAAKSAEAADSSNPAAEEELSPLPDFDDDATLTAADSSPATEELSVLPDFDDAADSSSSRNAHVEDSAITAAFTLPDFDDADSSAQSSDAFTASVFELPDFDDGTGLAADNAATAAEKSSQDDLFLDLPDFSASPATSAEEEFKVPDFDNDFNTQSADADTDFDSLFGVSSAAAAAADSAADGSMDFAPQNMFDNLYDQETMAGKSSSGYEEESEEVKKRTRLPVIICVACAAICLLSLLGILFWKVRQQPQLIADARTEAPSRPAGKKLPAGTEPATEPPQSEPPATEPAVPAKPAVTEKQPEPPAKAEDTSAKENEIVIAAVPSTMVPEQPAKPKQKIPDIRYKVNWGDTLWDISNAYYKNPWRYKELAAYNGIKNPNYIKAGSYILIPAE